MRSLVSITLLFFAYIIIIIFVLPVESLGEPANSHVGAPTAEVIRELVYFGFCAVGIRAWRNPVVQLIPRVGVFSTCCIVINVLLTLVLLAILVPTEKISFKATFVDVHDYAGEALTAELKRQLGEPLPDWLTKLPTWEETCPPWRRYVISNSVKIP